MVISSALFAKPLFFRRVEQKKDCDRRAADDDVASRFVCVCVFLCIPLFEPLNPNENP